MTRSPPRTAIALAYGKVLLAGILWGTSGPFSVALHRMGVPPSSLALLRPAAGGLFLLVLVLLLDRRRSPGGNGRAVDAGAPTRDLPGMLIVGGGIVALFQLAYQMSTDAVGVPATVALLYLAPAMVVAASTRLFGEQVTLAKGALAATSIAGVWLTVLGTRGVDVELTTGGLAWGALCGVGYAAYTLFGKWYGPRHGPLLPLFWSTLGGTLVLAVAWAVRVEPIVLPGSALAWGTLGLFGLFTIALAALLLFDAMRTLEAGRASIGTTVEPLAAALLAWWLLEQTLTISGIAGLVLLVIGVAGAYALPVRPGRRRAEASRS